MGGVPLLEKTLGYMWGVSGAMKTIGFAMVFIGFAMKTIGFTMVRSPENEKHSEI